jgi:D-lyxose ketol-isomerase
LLGEVAGVNDETTDNIFINPIEKFADIEEDTTPLYPLVFDYIQLLT